MFTSFLVSNDIKFHMDFFNKGSSDVNTPKNVYFYLQNVILFISI